ncbi:unannotated protein [freshwater metagenome]|uniref:Unannotated protein n=1 Tax=freshwater metagenome TaxID=449393 RepID=A0A6J6RW57_9ZZZZ|nr:hypothetical protein [Actinomycetota bacterium]
MADLKTLLVLQEHDRSIDQLQYRHAHHPLRQEIALVNSQITKLEALTTDIGSARDEAARNESKRANEVAKFSEHAAVAEARLYSGDVTAPRELQALQADIEQLKRQVRGCEDLQLEAMEIREPLDAQLAEVTAARAEADVKAKTLSATLATELATIDSEIDQEVNQRNSIASTVAPELLADYDRRRANGAGAARLVGVRCEGCHLTIPNVEAERIRKAPEGTAASCENCGCILVP